MRTRCIPVRIRRHASVESVWPWVVSAWRWIFCDRRVGGVGGAGDLISVLARDYRVVLVRHGSRAALGVARFGGSCRAALSGATIWSPAAYLSPLTALAIFAHARWRATKREAADDARFIQRQAFVQDSLSEVKARTRTHARTTDVGALRIRSCLAASWRIRGLH